jgi:3-phosphoshikimate 1-carboxyvinyltransferase
MEERAVRPVSNLESEVVVPGSKSLTNRALICAALADGTSTLRGWLESDDTEAMRDGLGRLGVETEEHAGDLLVRGTGGRLAIPLHPIDCRASGTTIRFLTSCAALAPGRVVLDGSPRMRQRPIQELADALSALGVRTKTVAGCPPITIHGGTVSGGRIAIDAGKSSQYLSSLLMIGPMTEQGIDLTASALTSRPYVEMTIDVMSSFGVPVERRDPDRFVIGKERAYRARAYVIEPDASSATYFFAAAAITGGRVRVAGITPASSQADVRFVEVLERMGCRVERGASWTAVNGAPYLHGVDVDMNAMPDAALTLAVVACFARGATRIRNVPNLRLKETDRMAALKAELEKLGASVTTTETDLEIDPPEAVRPASIATYDDHRIAMSFAVAGLKADGIKIQDPGCVSKTFPDFFERLEELC